MEINEIKKFREYMLFCNTEFLDSYEDPDQLFDNFIYDTFGPAAGAVFTSLYSQDQQ